MIPFNRILRSFSADLARPEYAARGREVAELVSALRGRGLPLRLDEHRDWEYAHVLLEVDRIMAKEPLRRVLDIGGGNTPLAHCLCRRGLRVVSTDVDAEAVAAINANARALPEPLLSARAANGAAIAEEPFDLVVCVSVIESVPPAARPSFWRSLRGSLRPGGSALLTFDYGDEGRFVGDPPRNAEELEVDLVRASGLELVGAMPGEPDFGPEGPPVEAVVPTVDGRGERSIAYTFGALRLRRPLATR